uniref:NAD-glutamate dehydrogenase domain-containing protein n=1 Tax=uncultured Sphingomonas sp. TaxID=158754 RepID=UPI0035C9831F
MADISTTSLSDALAARLTRGALPGELTGFGPAEVAAAAAFVVATGLVRTDEAPAIAIEPMVSDDTRRRVRLAVVNDDMPFLVDSIAAAIGARDIAIDRIIHPIVRTTRNAAGELTDIGGAGNPESLIYIEMDRIDARDRRALIDQMIAVLADVRAAVADWRQLQRAMAEDEAALPQGEGAALLQWLLDGHFTLLGHQVWNRADGAGVALGIARNTHVTPILADASKMLAAAWFDQGGEAPLLLKSSLISTVHRSVPLDLVVVPVKADRKVTGLSIHAGLWTSAALAAPPRDVPVLRARLAALEAKFGFDRKGHTGKALTHALTALPHDLVCAFAPAALESLVLTAMSLADRPRPALVLVESALGRHVFAFVWLPRDEVTTSRRVAIGEMLAAAANGIVVSWSIALEDGGVALTRYTIDVRGGGRMPDPAPLDRRLEQMVRGWVPNAEAALAEQLGPARAARLALRWAATFPQSYRNATTIDEAAADIQRIAALADDQDRSVRLYPAQAGPEQRLKIYRLGGALALSDAVPVLENFGFRVIGELPTRLADETGAHVHEFAVEVGGGAFADDPAVLEDAIAAVLRGTAENDAFNGLIVEAGLAPASVILLRAWFRYLRQAGLTYGMATVVDALRRSPALAKALIHRFAAAHDPAAPHDIAAADAAVTEALDAVSAIDDDRILRAYRNLIAATLRTNAFAPAAEEALAFKFDSHLIPGLPAPVPWREIWVYSPRVEGIHLRAGPVARGGLRWSDRRDDFRTEILGLMKAQRVKNAVIVPTGAKGGFYPKQLPSPANRDAWLAEGTESYRMFIRALLSVTDNIAEGKVVHPQGVTILDGKDPYFVVAADKGTATFSDVANALALERDYWLGDAFASGGSYGYDHKAMGITAKGAWISVQRHFAERGIDVQTQPISVVGCGDMSGDVFGNGMLLSKALKLVAAFDHRHIFLDPDP